jgi:hypothetical protein
LCCKINAKFELTGAIRPVVLIAWQNIDQLMGFSCWRLRRRTPGPPPFSSTQRRSPDTGILRFFLLPLPQPQPRATTVLVDELDAGGF